MGKLKLTTEKFCCKVGGVLNPVLFKAAVTRTQTNH